MGKMNKNVIAKMHRILLTTDTEKNSALSGPATVVLAPQAYICRAMCHGAILRWIGTRRADLFWPRPLLGGDDDTQENVRARRLIQACA